VKNSDKEGEKGTLDRIRINKEKSLTKNRKSQEREK
jgi:hypothetical protein